MSPLKLAQKKRIQKDSLLMFHVKTTASLTTKPIYFPLESWEGATTNNETAGFRCLRKKLPAEQLLVEGFEVPLWHFTERHFRNPGMFVGMFVYCASGTCSFYVFFWLEQQLCCHKHVIFVLQVGDVSCFILFVQVWKDRSVDVSTFLMCVFVFPYFELEWLFLFQGMDDSRTWASSKVHSPPQKKHQLHAWCLTCILNQSAYICKERPFPEPYHEYSSVEPLQEVHSIGEVFSKSFLVIYGHRESTFLTKELLWWRQL